MKKLDMKEYTALARQLAAEGIVMLKNDENCLPLKAGTGVSIFGRTQQNYYKSGTGSGGLVNTPYVVGILEALREEKLNLNEDLAAIYEAWTREHPFDAGKGWAQEPWSQEEMPLTDAQVKDARAVSEVAIVLLGRTAGEDRDAALEKGSYLLTDAEEDMLCKVCKAFEKVVVLLNAGGIMDMRWVTRYAPAAVLYVWQGGMEGGHGVADVLMGRVSPCGKLCDTIAKEIGDYPASGNFGDANRNYYAEDIYVGYRYFETFAQDRVLYPFGFGLSYTHFETVTEHFARTDKTYIRVKVTNRGAYPGKEVAQIYLQAPQGLLGKPLRVLAAFEKTKLLQPGEAQVLELEIEDYTIASYDDGGKTGNRSCYVLEQGPYRFYAGSSVRAAAFAGVFLLPETVVVARLQEAAAPATAFRRMVPQVDGTGNITVAYEPVPLRTQSVSTHMNADEAEYIPYTGNQGYQLIDVYDGKVTLNDFAAQLSDFDLCCIVKGEGMCSPKVTPGTAAAFGGITEQLKKLGIPCGCCADGPSGIRMDCGTLAFSLPGGASLACSFDRNLVEQLYAYEGAELRKNKIDTLLGPGINIHRHPLNGRNFEYFSEDPLLTGVMTVAQLKGMAQYGVTGTVKHFACNNQEYSRRNVDAVVSERALREIYLKAFEMAVKQGGAYSVMTAYNPVNGLWTAGHYDLCTRILRQEWGFDGMVMSDWSADISREGVPKSPAMYAAMVLAQNDIYMVMPDTVQAMGDLQTALEAGTLTRAHLVRSAKNILTMLLKSPAILYFADRAEDDAGQEDFVFEKEFVNLTPDMPVFEQMLVLPTQRLQTDRGCENTFGLTVPAPCKAKLTMQVKIDASDTAQVPISVFVNRGIQSATTLTGTNGAWIDLELELNLYYEQTFICLFFAIAGMQIRNLKLIRID